MSGPRRVNGGALVGLDLRGAQRDVVDAHVVDQPREELPVKTVPADLQRIRRGRNRTRVRRRRHLRPIHIQTQRRPVICLGQERPRVGRKLASAEGIRVAAARDQPRIRLRRVRRRRLQIEVVIGLVDHIPPVRVDRRRINPRLQSHPTRQLQRRRIRNRHHRTRPVEAQRPAELPRRAPSRIRDRPVVAVARRVRDRRPRPLIKPVRRHEGRRVRTRGLRDGFSHQRRLPRLREHDLTVTQGPPSAGVRARCPATRALGCPAVGTLGPAVRERLPLGAVRRPAPRVGMRCPADHPWARRPPTCLARRRRTRRRAHRGRSDDRCDQQEPGPATRATCHTTYETNRRCDSLCESHKVRNSSQTASARHPI